MRTPTQYQWEMKVFSSGQIICFGFRHWDPGRKGIPKYSFQPISQHSRNLSCLEGDPFLVGWLIFRGLFSTTRWLKVTQLDPQTLEVTNNPWKGHFNHPKIIGFSRITREDWGTLGNIRESPPLGPPPLNNQQNCRSRSFQPPLQVTLLIRMTSISDARGTWVDQGKQQGKTPIHGHGVKNQTSKQASKQASKQTNKQTN